MKPILILSSLLVLPVISNYQFIKEYFSNKSNNLDKLVDHSRHGVNSYGLKWGARTDEIVSL